MFKNALFVLVFLAMLSAVFAVRLVEPIYQENLSSGDFVGSIMPGSTLELIFSKEFGKYDSLKLISSLPAGFEYNMLNETDYAKLSIISPSNAVAGEYPITVELSGPKQTDSLSVYFLVENGLLDVSLDNYSASAVVGEKASYNFTFLNNSHADVIFKVVPNIPGYLRTSAFSIAETSMTITVPKKSSKSASLDIFPHMQGQKTFNTTVYFDNSSSKKTFSQRLDAMPSLKGKMQSMVYGVPFFSFSLLPSFLIDCLVSLFL
jgi:hypothetical protein